MITTLSSLKLRSMTSSKDTTSGTSLGKIIEGTMFNGAGNKPCADEIIMEMQEYKDANAKGKAVMEQVPESIRYRVYAFLHSKWGFGI